MDSAKRELLNKTLKDINKRFGANTAMCMDSKTIQKIDVISTGSYLIDRTIGVGGIPRGRIIEVFGPESAGKTTLALHVISQCQKAGGAAVMVDVEHALDPNYAKALGVNIDELIISQPDCGEDALEVTEALVRSGTVDLVVVDSVAALVPKAEIEGEMGDAFVGLHARLMSKALRKLVACVNETKTSIIFINQLREKVGVMYGCLHGDVLVNFVDGRSIPIKDVVEKKIKGCVWSYNETTCEFEAKEITDWHNNGQVLDVEDYLHIETDAYDHIGGTFGITVTPDHQVMTNNGWTEAKNLKLGDMILSKYKSVINGELANFLYGTLSGDSTISIRDKNTGSLRIQDNQNVEYMNWKISKLLPFIDFQKKEYRAHGKSLFKYESQYSSELAIIKNEIENRNPIVFLKNHFSNMGLALWFLDDGHYDDNDYHSRISISIKRFKNLPSISNEIVDALKNLGFNCKTSTDRTSLIFDVENSEKIFEAICPYVPSCMQYKLPVKYQNKYIDFELKNEVAFMPCFVAVKLIRFASARQVRGTGKTKYDISVKDNHNYMVGGITNGVIVHNSPEVTTGGRALKFYSSLRIEVRKTETLKKGTEQYGHKLKVKIVKNKLAPPFKETEVTVLWGKGIDATCEILDLAIETNIIDKSGAWFTYDEQRFQGREKVSNYFEENPSEFEILREKVVSALEGKDSKVNPIKDVEAVVDPEEDGLGDLDD